MKFTPRLTRPEKGNKYYIRKASGGWAGICPGSPVDPDCDVLANCVGYAAGRFCEICGRGAVDLLVLKNGEDIFAANKGSFRTGSKPEPGAVMCWAKGKVLCPEDGYGHVAIVERVISDTEVVTSESAYGGKAFYTKNRKKGADGRWGQGEAYTFQGFIYPPVTFEAEKPEVTATEVKTEKYRLAYFANLREKPDAASAKLAGLEAGTAVEVEKGSETVFKGTDGKDYVYVKVRWNGKTGWIVKSAVE